MNGLTIPNLLMVISCAKVNFDDKAAILILFDTARKIVERSKAKDTRKV
jgi:hypothetical protein